MPFSTAVDVVVGSWGGKEASTLVGDAEQLWTACTEALRSSVPDAVWNSCFQPTEARSLIDDHLIVAVPSVLVKERIESRWLEPVHKALAELGAPQIRLELTVSPNAGVTSDELFPGAGGCTAALRKACAGATIIGALMTQASWSLWIGRNPGPGWTGEPLGFTWGAGQEG